MTRTFCLILWSLWSSGYLSAQIKLKGKIIDLSNHQPLPYATIGVKGKSFGSVTDAQGTFDFEIPADSVAAHDQVIVSSVGYQPLVTSVRDMANNGQLSLQPATTTLKEIAIKPDINQRLLAERVIQLL